MWRDYLQRVLHWIGHVIRQPWEELNRWQRAARFAYDLSRHGAAQLKEDRAPQMAAALAFQTLFALVPVLVVVMLIVQAFMPLNEFEGLVGRMLEWAGLTQVTAPNGVAAEPQDASLQIWLSGLIHKAADTNLTVVGWIGFGVIVYSAVSMLVTIETSFNTVYRAPAGRPWSRRVPLYWFLITISPAAFYATASAHSLVEDWAAGDSAVVAAVDAAATDVPPVLDELGTNDTNVAEPATPTAVERAVATATTPTAAENRPSVAVPPQTLGRPWYLTVVHIAWSLCIGWLFWFVVYSLVPNTTVSLQSSAIGALVCAVLLEVAKRFLGAYLQNAFSISHLYGSLGLVPLFMFWVYLIWLFILFGLEVSATLQFLGNRTLEEIETRRATTGLVEPSAVVSVMEVVAQDFRMGQSTQQRRIADRTGVPERAVATIVKELCAAGLLHRIERDQTAVCLAQSPELVTADRLMEIGFRLADGAGERRISEFAVRLREHQRALAGSITLASLLPSEPG